MPSEINSNRHQTQTTTKKETRAKRTPFSDTIGSILATGVEQVTFQPVDTTAKRLMAGKAFSLRGSYNGFLPAIIRKAPMRSYKWAAQNQIFQLLDSHYKPFFQYHCGDYSKVAMQTIAGVATGIGEPLFFQWIDTLQIRRQALGAEGQTYLQSAQSLGVSGLWRGSVVTAFGRNAPGCLGLFGGSALADKYLENENRADRTKNLSAKLFGAVSSLIFSQPVDVIKTNMQTKNLTFWLTMKELSVKQLCTAGLAPRLLMAGKVGVGFFLADEFNRKAAEFFGDVEEVVIPKCNA